VTVERVETLFVSPDANALADFAARGIVEEADPLTR
jgi:hypothetical protein